MPSSITNSPGSLTIPAGQRLIYTFATSESPIPDDFRFVVTIEEEGTTEIGRYVLIPNSAGVAHMDVSSIVENQLDVDTQDNDGNQLLSDYVGDPLSKATKASCGFVVGVGSYASGTTTIKEDTESLYVVRGYRQQREGLHPSFSDYYGLNSSRKTWLTELEPDGNEIHMDVDPDDLGAFAFVYNDVNGTSLYSISARVYNGASLVSTTLQPFSTAGLSLSSSSGLLRGNLMGYFKGMPGNYLKLISYTGAWTRIEYYLINSSFQQSSNKLILNNRCVTTKHEHTQLCYTNEHGGFDYLLFNGRRELIIEQSSKDYRPIQGTWDAATFAVEASAEASKPFYKDVKRQYQLTALWGWSELRRLEGLYKARNVFMRIGTAFVPVKVTAGSANVRQQQRSNLQIVTMSVQLNEDLRC